MAPQPRSRQLRLDLLHSFEAAARRLHSRYCELAHEKVLWEKFADQREPDELELSMMDFAGRVAAGSGSW